MRSRRTASVSSLVGSGGGNRSAGIARMMFGSGESARHTSRWTAKATPGKSQSSSRRSVISWKCRCGGQSPFSVGAPPENGDWPPHLHFQLITDLLELDCDFPGVAFAVQRDVWRALLPHPNIILAIPADRFPPPQPTKEETLA